MKTTTATPSPMTTSSSAAKAGSWSSPTAWAAISEDRSPADWPSIPSARPGSRISAEEPRELLIRAFRNAQQAILRYAHEHPELQIHGHHLHRRGLSRLAVCSTATSATAASTSSITAASRRSPAITPWSTGSLKKASSPWKRPRSTPTVMSSPPRSACTPSRRPISPIRPSPSGPATACSSAATASTAWSVIEEMAAAVVVLIPARRLRQPGRDGQTTRRTR